MFIIINYYIISTSLSLLVFLVDFYSVLKWFVRAVETFFLLAQPKLKTLWYNRACSECSSIIALSEAVS